MCRTNHNENELDIDNKARTTSIMQKRQNIHQSFEIEYGIIAASKAQLSWYSRFIGRNRTVK